MGRHSSDSEDDGRSSRRKKKHRRRSSSSSSSGSRAGRSHRSWTKDRDRRRRRRSSSSSSYESSRRKRSRSPEKSKHRSRRSRSRNRRSGSRRRRSRSRSSGRSSRRRSRSQSRSRRSRRKGRSRDREKGRDRDKDRDKDKAKDKEPRATGDGASIKAAVEHLTPAEQTKATLHLVLQAAARTDQVLKAKEKKEEEARKRKEEEELSLEEQVLRIKDMEAINSESFVPQAFKSSRDGKKVSEAAEVKPEEETVAPPPEKAEASLPTGILYHDNDSLAHPSLFLEKEVAEERWMNRLVSLRQERLMGSPVP